MQLSVTLNPNARLATILLMLYTHAVPTGAAPVQLPSQGLQVVHGVFVHWGSEGWNWRRKWFSNNALLGVRALGGSGGSGGCV